MNRAAFIDRDGVINEDRAYVYRVADFHFIPGAVTALRVLRQAGFLLVVITNQSGIARGLFSEDDYRKLEAHMRARLSEAGVSLDSIQYCPHGPDGDCDCRKPKPGMILAAARQLDIDLSQSILIGDRTADLAAGRAAGVGRCCLVRSGEPLSDSDVLRADGVYEDLDACARDVIRSAG